MTLPEAIRLMEVLLGLSLIQQGLEHLHWRPFNRSIALVFATRVLLAMMLVMGVSTGLALLALLVTTVIVLSHFGGPTNGGSDRMGILVMTMLAIAHLHDDVAAFAIGYLGLQLLMSYFQSGWVKLRNPDWRSGTALRDVFSWSAYPASEATRGFAQSSTLLLAVSWAVILLEVLFPLALLNQNVLICALALAALFHAANAVFLGLNRFLWTWIAAFPALIWLQTQV